MNEYTVEIDGERSIIKADSLAAACNQIRGKGKHICVWSSMGILLIDTEFGDIYDIGAP